MVLAWLVRAQAYFRTEPQQYAASAVVLVVFLTAVVAVYRAGDPLKRRGLDGDVVEAVQSVATTVLGILASTALVVVWHATADVAEALQAVVPPEGTGIRLLVSGIALATAYTATRITKRLVKLGAGRDAISAHQREVAHYLVQILVYAPALVFLVTLWGVPVGNLLLGAGAVGIVVGLAARQTLGAVLAGFVLLFSRPFEVGDWIEVDGREGIVTDVSVVNTRLRTFDDEVVVIPNDQVANTDLVNRSRNDRLRVRVEVGVDYGVDIERAMAVAAEAMADRDALASRPEPDVVVERFGDSAVVLALRFYIDHPTIQRKWRAQNAVVEAVKAAFEREGIKIPFPQRELAGRAEAGGLRVTSDDAPGAGRATTGETDDDPDAAKRPGTAEERSGRNDDAGGGGTRTGTADDADPDDAETADAHGDADGGIGGDGDSHPAADGTDRGR